MKRDPYVDIPPHELARTHHPIQSHEAAEEIQVKLNELQREALWIVKDQPGKTTNELAVLFNLRDPRKIGRRFPELRGVGLIVSKVRKCTITGRNAAAWSPKPEGGQTVMF